MRKPSKLGISDKISFRSSSDVTIIQNLKKLKLGFTIDFTVQKYLLHYAKLTTTTTRTTTKTYTVEVLSV